MKKVIRAVKRDSETLALYESSSGRRLQESRGAAIEGESVRPARLVDVAALASVSTATVSRYLNTPEQVRPALRERVAVAVQRLGYVPHGAARALASSRTRTIGAVIPTVDNAIFASGIQALQRQLSAAGYTLLLACSEYDHANEVRQVESFVTRGVDGVMLVGEAHDPQVYRLLSSKATPYVNTWMYRADSIHPCIGFDNREAAYRVASYLADIGHTEIAMIAGVTAQNDRAAERVEGVRHALAERIGNSKGPRKPHWELGWQPIPA